LHDKFVHNTRLQHTVEVYSSKYLLEEADHLHKHLYNFCFSENRNLVRTPPKKKFSGNKQHALRYLFIGAHTHEHRMYVFISLYLCVFYYIYIYIFRKLYKNYLLVETISHL